MKKLLFCLALAASIMFSGCGGKGVTTKIDPPVNPPVVTKRAWSGTIAVREFGDFNAQGDGLYFLGYNKPVQTLAVKADEADITWSPNGQYLAIRKFISATTFSNPAIINLQGQEISNGTKNLQYNSGLLAWTPDSTNMVYGVYMNGIYALSTTGVERLVMTSWSATYDHNIFFDNDYMYWVHHEYGGSCTLYRVTMAQFNAGFNCADAEKIVDFTTADHDASVYFVPLADHTLIMSYSAKIGLVDPVAKTITDLKPKFNYDFDHIRLSPNKQYLAVNTYDGIKILKVSDFSLVKTINLDFEDSIAWSPDSDAIVSVNDDYSSSGTIVSISWLSDGKIETVTTIKHSAASKRTAYGDIFCSVGWTR